MSEDLFQLLPNRGVMNGGLYCLRHRVAIILSSPAGNHPELAAEPDTGHPRIDLQSTKTGLLGLLNRSKSSDTHPLLKGTGVGMDQWLNEDMGFADAVIFVLLAFADFSFLVYLRRARARRHRDQKMMRCLAIAVDMENASDSFPVLRRWPTRRAG